MPVRITETTIRAELAKAAQSGKRGDVADTLAPGLRFRASPSGRGTWGLACRDKNGNMRRFSIGDFPAVSISAARDRARDLHDKVRHEGADPVAEKRGHSKAAQDAKKGLGTLEALIALYGEQGGARLKSWAETVRSSRTVFAGVLLKPANRLTRNEMQAAADSWRSAQSAAAAVRRIRPVLKWGARRGLVAADLADLDEPVGGKTRIRTRVLSEAELAKLLPVLRGSDSPHAAAMLLMLLTTSRREEICDARWADLSGDVLTLRVKDTKASQSDRPREHQIPLSRQALALVEGRRTASSRPQDRIFSTETGGRLSNWHRETKIFHEASGVEGWHRHDLRRTASTMMGDMGVYGELISSALGHRVIHSARTSIYNQSRYLPQVREALQMLADRLDSIAGGGAVASETLSSVRS